MALKTTSKTVTTAGTQVPLSATALIVSAYSIRAKGTNTGNVYLGDSNVDNTAHPIPALSGIDWEGQPNERENLAVIYVDADVSGEGVDIMYIPD